jgi:hypothetical protein
VMTDKIRACACRRVRLNAAGHGQEDVRAVRELPGQRAG